MGHIVPVEVRGKLGELNFTFYIMTLGYGTFRFAGKHPSLSTYLSHWSFYIRALRSYTVLDKSYTVLGKINQYLNTGKHSTLCI